MMLQSIPNQYARDLTFECLFVTATRIKPITDPLDRSAMRKKTVIY